MKTRMAAMLLLAVSCAPPPVKPVSSPDPEAGCPGGAARWSLELSDGRAERSDSRTLLAGLRDSLTRSFPACRWEAGAGTIRIDVHRFRADFDGEVWNAVADWTVLVSDAGGRTTTQFDAVEEAVRPNYRAVNNEKAALQEVFDRALQRTLAGLRNVRIPG
jgi:hypothetical protein